MGRGSFLKVQTASYLVCSVIIIIVLLERVLSDESQNLGDTVRTLKVQMNVLLQRRQEDFNILEKAIKSSWNKNSELISIKTQLKELRENIARIKESKEPSLNKQKNDRLTLQWLSLTVSELRAELAEISAANNASFEIQQKQQLVSDMNLLRGDVASFGKDLEELKAKQKQTAADFAQLKQEFENNINSKQEPFAKTSETISEIDKMKKEMEFFTKLLPKLIKNNQILKKSFFQGLKKQFVNFLSGFFLNHNYRHNRLFQNKQTEYYGGIFEKQLDDIFNNFKKNSINLSLLNKENFGDCSKMCEKLSDKIIKLEEIDKSTFKQIFNMSKQIAELERLHLSILQLLETVENLEIKVDKYIPNFQKEISKMEFSLDQTAASFFTIKDDYEHQKFFVKNFAKKLKGLEEQLENNSSYFNSLQTQIINTNKMILQWKVNNSIDINREKIQESRILALEEKLKQFTKVMAEEAQGTIQALMQILKLRFFC